MAQSPELALTIQFVTVSPILSPHPIRHAYASGSMEPSKMKRKNTINWINGIICAAMLVSAVAAAGCQVSIAGQTLPSPYYFKDDIQYFQKGPEFKLSREAAALEAQKADAAIRGQ